MYRCELRQVKRSNILTQVIIKFFTFVGRKTRRSATNSSTSSTISTNSMKLILERLKSQSCRKSTNQTYLNIWRNFNNFVIHLDVKPDKWEDRVSLFLAHMIDKGLQSSSVKSYVSAIKKILVIDSYPWDDNAILLSTLTRACRGEPNQFPFFPVFCFNAIIFFFPPPNKYQVFHGIANHRFSATQKKQTTGFVISGGSPKVRTEPVPFHQNM